jgi:hypothetical protein
MKDEAQTGAGDGDRTGQVGAAVKETIAGCLQGIGTIETAMVSLLRQTVAETLRATDATASDSLAVVSEVVRGALQATEEEGTGLIVSTKSLTKGVVMGVSDVGGDILTWAHHAVKGTVASAAACGADVAVVASQAVQGVLEAARETGGEVGEAALAAATGAIEAASALSHTAVRAVSATLMEGVQGIQELLGVLLPSSVQHFRLDDRLMEQELEEWYATTAVGDTAVVALSVDDLDEVRLIRQEHGHVHWWPEGDRGVTVPLENAVMRLQMLRGPAEA